MRSRYIVVLVLFLLAIPVMDISGSDEEPPARVDLPDLVLEDIWMSETDHLFCRIRNIGGFLSSTILINLTVNEQILSPLIETWDNSTEFVDYSWPDPLPWMAPTMMIEINIIIFMGEDSDPSNNYRMEVFEKSGEDPPVHVKNIYVRSVSVDPRTYETYAYIGNDGYDPVDENFTVSIAVNEMEMGRGYLTETLNYSSVERVYFGWEWDPVLAPVNIMVYADLDENITETDVGDNLLSVNWISAEDLIFTAGPSAVNITTNGGELKWETNRSAHFRVDFGKVGNLKTVEESQVEATNGSVELQDLNPRSQYAFRVTAETEDGEVIRSGINYFTTPYSIGSLKPTAAFPDLARPYPPSWISYPFTASDESGIEKIDFMLDGENFITYGGGGSKGISNVPLDLSNVEAGEHEISARVYNLQGNSYSIGSTIVVTEDPFDPIERVNFDFDPEGQLEGIVSLAVTCIDLSGIRNVTWLIDGETVEVQEVADFRSLYQSNHIWDTRFYPNGIHNVTVIMRNVGGDLFQDSIFPDIFNMVSDEPALFVKRGYTTTSGTVCKATIQIRNVGESPVRDIVLRDHIKGFVPIDGFDECRFLGDSGSRWEVVLSIPLLESEEEAVLSYNCIPVLTDENEWELGTAVLSNVDDSDEIGFGQGYMASYTTEIEYRRIDGLVNYTKRHYLHPADFASGVDPDTGIMDVLDSSKYVMLTCPPALYSTYGTREGVDNLLIMGGKLLAERAGVFGFVYGDDGAPPTNMKTYENLQNWSIILSNTFSTSGYLSILGEDGIIPSWNRLGISHSDLPYSNLNGGLLPYLFVGRYIGNTLEGLEVQLETAIGIANGDLVNDHTGSALLISGIGDYSATFRSSINNLGDYLEQNMDSVEVHHKGDLVDHGSYTSHWSGKTTEMASGDLDGDGKDELVFFSRDMERVAVVDPEDGSEFTFDVDRSLPTSIAVGDVHESEGCEILIAEDVGAMENLRIYSGSGSLLETLDANFSRIEPIHTLDIDGEGLEEILIYRKAVGRMDVLNGIGTIVDTIPVERNTQTFAMMRVCDVDDDGEQDIITIAPSSRRIDIYFGPDWTNYNFSVPMGPTTGIGVGNFLPDGDPALAVLYPGYGGFLKIITVEYDQSTDSYYHQETMEYLTTVESGLEIQIMETDGTGPEEEIVVILEKDLGTISVIDYADQVGSIEYPYSNEFTDIVIDKMSGKDLIQYFDHGGIGVWCDIFTASQAPLFGFTDSIHRPVIYGAACSTGRYYGSGVSFAEACMVNGAGVYIGASQIAFLHMTTDSLEITEEFSNGTPISHALRDFKRRAISDDPDLRGSGYEYKRIYALEYNLFGDPAFGIPGSNYQDWESREGLDLDDSGNYNDIVRFGDPIFFDVYDGYNAFLPGGMWREIAEGLPIPYQQMEYQIPQGYAVEDVQVFSEGAWDYYEDILIAPVNNAYLDDGGEPISMTPTRFEDGTYDPLGAWSDHDLYDWEVVDGGKGDKTLILRVHPFQYDETSMAARFCSDWNITVRTVESDVTITEFHGPSEPVDVGGIMDFSYAIGSSGSEEIISVTQSVEDVNGNHVDTISSQVLDINQTTICSGSWDSTGSGPGTYFISVRIRSGTGAVLCSYIHFVMVGTPEVKIESLSISDTTFDNETVIDVTAVFRNTGDFVMVGAASIDLMGSTGEIISVFNGSSSLDTGESLTESHQINMSGLEQDIYFVRATFDSDIRVVSRSEVLIREGSIEPDPPSHSLVLDFFTTPSDPVVNDIFVINGSIRRSDGLILPNITVTAWTSINGTNIKGDATSRLNGSFAIELRFPESGDFTVNLLARVGDMVGFTSFTVSVNGTIGDDDDNVTDDDSDDDSDDTGGDEGTGDGFDARWCIVIVIIVICILIFSVLLIYTLQRRRSGGVSDWEE